MINAKNSLVAVLVTLILALDLTTKSWALEALADGRTIDLFGGLVPLTLAFNRGAAFGLSLGADPRWIFVPITVVAIGFLIALIREAGNGERLRLVAASLILGGAAGNLYDRVRWDRGVVDFIGPVDLGFMLWPIFNVADSAITTGAVLLAVSFWREETRERASASSDGGEGEGTRTAPETSG